MAPKLLANDVAAFGDAELDQYLQGSRLTRGVAIVQVEDWENLPESFIQRLR
jgi:hypothetical protein